MRSREKLFLKEAFSDNFWWKPTAGSLEHSKRHAVCLGQTHSQVQLLPGAFSQVEVLLDEEADVLMLQLSLTLQLQTQEIYLLLDSRQAIRRIVHVLLIGEN